MVKYGFVSSRIKFKFSRVKVCVVVGYGPNEGDDEERDRFWNNMDRTLDSVQNIRAEVEVRVDKLKNGKAAGKDEITGEMIKGGGDRVMDWIWRLYNMAFESGVVAEDWRSIVIVPLYKSKGERTECKNYRGISLVWLEKHMWGSW